ncbi:MAG: VWA domain-containing protein [Gemmatimonadetes bacterium]|nr:VWA domain-containing protein [Gemmatimonadota bacterium]
MSGRDLVAHLAGFARALRAQGLGVGLSDEVDAAAALTLVDLFDLDEVRCALRTALKIRRSDWELFDQLFRRLWLEDDTTVRSLEAQRAGPPPTLPPMWPPALPRAGAAPVVTQGGQAPQGGSGEGQLPGYSPDVLLRRKPFEQCTPRDLAEMERLLARLSLKLATRPSRRLVPTEGRGFVDLRRSFRRAVGTRGDFVFLARRAHAVERSRLVLLCDTSGSMDPHSRFLLAFILSLKRVARRTEAFAFNTTLTRLTPWLAPGKIGVTLDRLAAGVPDWSGGTRIGESLAAFVSRYQRRVLDPRTVVVILSDGLDRGEPEVLVQAMRAIRARARRLIWLNPLLGDARYRPLARGMEAALPFVDHFAPAHNLESLERLVSVLAA